MSSGVVNSYIIAIKVAGDWAEGLNCYKKKGERFIEYESIVINRIKNEMKEIILLGDDKPIFALEMYDWGYEDDIEKKLHCSIEKAMSKNILSGSEGSYVLFAGDFLNLYPRYLIGLMKRLSENLSTQIVITSINCESYEIVFEVINSGVLCSHKDKDTNPMMAPYVLKKWV